MNKFKVQTFNNIAAEGLQQFPNDNYEIASELMQPDVILLRSFDLHKIELPTSVKAVGRAGAGVNNVPVEALTAQGTPVFNTPGANANAVKELTLASLIIASRHVCEAWQFAKQLDAGLPDLKAQVENAKKQFRGNEILGKTLGVIGLGAIGVEVANAALKLGMQVVGHDPAMTVGQAWRLSAEVQQAQTLDQLLAESDFVTLHLPLIEKTKNLIDSNRLAVMKKNAVLLNFSRGGIVDNCAVKEFLQQQTLRCYVNDFPEDELKDHPGVLSFPHLGASTGESEINCAKRVVRQIRDYLEQGSIHHSVNFPEIEMPWREGNRLAIVNRNIPNMVGQVSTALASQNLNVLDLINRSRGEVAYTLIDVDQKLTEQTMQQLTAIDGVISVREIGQR